MSENFTSILDAPAAEATRPPALPNGTYVAVIGGLPTQGKSQKKNTPYIEYKAKIISVATDEDGNSDVDAEALEEFGNVQGKEFRLTFYFTEGSAYRHKEFLEDDLGIDLEGKSHWEAAQEAPGSQFLVSMKRVPTQDGKGFFTEVAKTAPVGE